MTLTLLSLIKLLLFGTQEFNEVGWFYCSANSAEVDRYVVFNYQEQVWSVGQLERHAWHDAGLIEKPIATGTDTNNYLYEHEVGNDADGSAMANVFIESSDFDIADGEEFSFLRRIIPDIKFNGSAGAGQGVKYVLKNRDFNASSLTTSETKSVLDSTTKLDVRVRARQLAFRIEGDDSATGVGWRLDATRFDLNKSGKKIVAKLIETRLPTVTTEAVTYKEFNRLVRVLEINLNRFDPDATFVSTATRDAGNFEEVLLYGTQLKDNFKSTQETNGFL